MAIWICLIIKFYIKMSFYKEDKKHILLHGNNKLQYRIFIILLTILKLSLNHNINNLTKYQTESIVLQFYWKHIVLLNN